MSVKQMPVRVDDLDGTVLYEEGRTTTIVLDGEKVELDLSMQHYNELKEALAPYFKAGLGVRNNNGGGRRTTAATSSSTTTSTKTSAKDLSKIRDWATRNGYKVSARGRIPYSVMDAYAKSHVSSES